MFSCPLKRRQRAVKTLGGSAHATACTATQVPNSDHAAAGSITGTTDQTVPIVCDAGFIGGGVAKCLPDGHFEVPQCTARPWTKVFQCDGPTSTNRLLYTPDQIKAMAQDATQVKFCTKGSTTDCETSTPNSFPIKMLRLGDTMSQDLGTTCGAACVATNWTGPRSTNMASNCTGANTTNGQALTGGGDALLYWACANGYGLHLSAKDGGLCGWTAGASSNIEMYIDPVKACTPTQVPDSDHAAVGSITGMTGQEVTVACNPGFTGGGKAVCGLDGKFNPLSCQANSCTATQVPNSDHAAPGSIQGTTNQTVPIVCNAGYEGGGTAKCQADGTFTVPACTASWKKILQCNGNTPGNRLLYTPDQIKAMAQTASQVKICTAGSTTDCEVSNPGSFPIQMLRLGNSLSQDNGAICGPTCAASAWTGPRTSNMANNCTGPNTTNGQALTGGGDALLYWACANGYGLHLSAKDGGLCGWTAGANSNLEVYIK